MSWRARAVGYKPLALLPRVITWNRMSSSTPKTVPCSPPTRVYGFGCPPPPPEEIASARITFKGPRQHGQLKNRAETETTVGSFPAAAELLECLGYIRILSFEKRRQSWTYQGCKVELDELPYIGSFVEIEGPGDELVLKVRQELQLADRPLIRASYIAMLMTHLQERGDARREISFEKR